MAKIIGLRSSHRRCSVFNDPASQLRCSSHRGEPAAARYRCGGNLRAPSHRSTGCRAQYPADGSNDACRATYAGHVLERLANSTDCASEHEGLRARRGNRASDASCHSTPALQHRESAARHRLRSRSECVGADCQFHAVRLRLALRWLSRPGPQLVSRTGRRSVDRFL